MNWRPAEKSWDEIDQNESPHIAVKESHPDDDINEKGNRLRKGFRSLNSATTDIRGGFETATSDRPRGINRGTVMGVWRRSQIEIFFFRLFRAGLLTGIIALFGRETSIYLSPEAGQATILAALIIQLLLIIRLPSKDIVPLKNRIIDIRGFFVDEFRFAGLIIAAAYFFHPGIDSYLFGLCLIMNFAAQTALFFAFRAYTRHSRKMAGHGSAVYADKSVVIVGAKERGMRTADLLLKHPELSINIVGFIGIKRKGLWSYRDIPLLGNADQVASIIAGNHVDFVIMAMEAEDFAETQRIFDTVEKMGIKVCVIPDIYDRTIAKCGTSSLNGQPVLLYYTVPDNRPALLFKAILDRIGALVGIIASAPILFLAALMIKIDSRGPVFYRQRRSGQNGRPFNMIKLRTMVCDAEKHRDRLKHLNEMSGPVFKIKNDPRITRVGKFLRKYSIDEFPQFFNVLAGDMSLVGPRPPLPEEVRDYSPWQHRRLSVKPGVTCLWQINGRNKVDFDEWMKLDLQYIDRWSLKEDARILIKTIPAVVRGKGAS